MPDYVLRLTLQRGLLLAAEHLLSQVVGLKEELRRQVLERKPEEGQRVQHWIAIGLDSTGPISMRHMWTLRRTHHAACVGWHR